MAILHMIINESKMGIEFLRFIAHLFIFQLIGEGYAGQNLWQPFESYIIQIAWSQPLDPYEQHEKQV